MTATDAQKPPLTIDLVAPEGNVFAVVAKACSTLEEWGHVEQSKALRTWFSSLPARGSRVSYDDVRRKVGEYCDVTWLNGDAPPEPQVE